MCGVFVLASRFTSTTLKITHLPSGETCGSPTRLSFIMSSKVKGCLAWGKAETVKKMRARKISKERGMGECSLKRLRRDVASYGVRAAATPPARDVAGNSSTANG